MRKGFVPVKSAVNSRSPIATADFTPKTPAMFEAGMVLVESHVHPFIGLVQEFGVVVGRRRTTTPPHRDAYTETSDEPHHEGVPREPLVRRNVGEDDRGLSRWQRD